jgi:hypothetical protein
MIIRAGIGRVLAGGVAFLGAAVALLWVWNTLAVDLFGAPVATFRHALAAQVAVLILVALVRWQRNALSPR